MPTRCFLIEPTNRYRRSLRRYVSFDSPSRECDKALHGYHQLSVHMDEIEADESPTSGDLWDHADERWPKACPCGYEFKEDDTWQLFIDAVYRRSDNGQDTTIRSADPGAMWYADWMPHTKGPDGRCLIVRLPNGGDWMIDGRADNCANPKDKEHKCWVRVGSPPNVTISKDGNTCATGAGSIGMECNGAYYHGFLRNGELTDA